MRKTAYIFIIVASLSACTAKKISNFEARQNNERIQKQNSAAIAAYKTYTPFEYIDRFKAIAIQEMNLYGIPASITLAQGLFESGNGNSELARVANNHFGIKTNSSWHGQVYYKNDDHPNDGFRVYKLAEESFRDHSEFLKKKNYAFLFELDKNDYVGWAYGLKKAGYATNPNYPAFLINIIQKYNLDKYDQPESPAQKVKREDRVLIQIDQNAVKAVRDSVVIVSPSQKIYVVKQGDTLYNISKRFGLTVDELKAINYMADDTLKIGQRLIIAK